MPDLGNAKEHRLDLVQIMRDIAASDEMDVADQIEFNGTLYVRATQRDELRAEIERLETELNGVMGGQIEQLQASVEYVNELRAENERLRAKEVELREELVRLRGEIWDLIHPSAPLGRDKDG